MQERVMTEVDKWFSREYPYDMAECGYCASMHARDNPECHEPEHEAMRKHAAKLGLRIPTAGTPPKIIRAFMAFRKRWAKFYPKP